MKEGFEGPQTPEQRFDDISGELSAGAMAASLGVLGGAKHFDARSITNDVLLVAWNQLEQGKPIHRPRAWASSVARRASFRLTKDEAKYAAGIADEANDTDESDSRVRTPESPWSISEAEFQEARSAVKKILDEFRAAKGILKPGDQLLVEGYYEQQLSSGKLAEKLGMSSGNVRQRWGRELLPEMLEIVRLNLLPDKFCAELLGSDLLKSEDFRFRWARLCDFLETGGMDVVTERDRSFFNVQMEG